MLALASRPGVFGVSLWGLLVAVLVGVLCITLAMADDAVYLRTVMPLASSDAVAVEPEPVALAADDAVEQRLVAMLSQDAASVPHQAVVNTERWRVVRMQVTAYCPCSICCGKFADGVTACNHKIVPGDTFVAADKMYRFGTDMIVPGYNNNQPVEVKDRGRVIKGNRLDVFFSSHSVAKTWGTRTLDVLVREN